MEPVPAEYKNNFDFLRLLFASMVIITHSYALLALDATDPFLIFLKGTALSSIGVSGFFVLSGYLIMGSIERAKSIRTYLWNRVRRIMPGLFVVLLFTVFIIGPLFTRLGPAAYFGQLSTYLYFLRSLFFIPTDNMLPGLFVDNPLPHVNGSLWTLRYEFLAYLSLVPVFFLGERYRIIYLLLVFVLMVVLQYLVLTRSGSLPESISYHLQNMSSLFISFYIGALLKAREALWLPHRRTILVLSAALLMFSYFLPVYFWNFCLFFVLPLTILSFGKGCSAIVQIPRAIGDISYGTYIYAFPAQQVLVTMGVDDVCVLILLSLLVSWTLGFLSFHLVEKKYVQRLRKAR